MSIQNLSKLVSTVDYLFVIKWISTFILLTGVALTTYNVYPMNVYVSLVGNLGWLYVGFMWREWSLITVQTVIVMIYTSGLITKALT